MDEAVEGAEGAGAPDAVCCWSVCIFGRVQC